MAIDIAETCWNSLIFIWKSAISRQIMYLSSSVYVMIIFLLYYECKLQRHALQCNGR